MTLIQYIRHMNDEKFDVDSLNFPEDTTVVTGNEPQVEVPKVEPEVKEIPKESEKTSFIAKFEIGFSQRET